MFDKLNFNRVVQRSNRASWVNFPKGTIPVSYTVSTTKGGKHTRMCTLSIPPDVWREAGWPLSTWRSMSKSKSAKELPGLVVMYANNDGAHYLSFTYTPDIGLVDVRPAMTAYGDSVLLKLRGSLFVVVDEAGTEKSLVDLMRSKSLDSRIGIPVSDYQINKEEQQLIVKLPTELFVQPQEKPVKTPPPPSELIKKAEPKSEMIAPPQVINPKDAVTVSNINNLLSSPSGITLDKNDLMFRGQFVATLPAVLQPLFGAIIMQQKGSVPFKVNDLKGVSKSVSNRGKLLSLLTMYGSLRQELADQDLNLVLWADHKNEEAVFLVDSIDTTILRTLTNPNKVHVA